MGDASLIAEQRAVMTAIQSRAAELKRQGKSADETASAVQTEIQARYPDWSAPARIAIIARTATRRRHDRPAASRRGASRR